MFRALGNLSNGRKRGNKAMARTDKYIGDEYPTKNDKDNKVKSSEGKKIQFIRLLGYFKPYLLLLILSILFAFLINGAVLIKPYIIKYVIDDYLAVGLIITIIYELKAT
jgi:ABC-type bacteriocin/lantibiotic exporter with double-glycine peptidase domain